MTLGETLEEGGAGAASAPPVRPYLFVVLEADRPLAGGARLALSGVDEVLIGRGAARAARRSSSSGRTQLVLEVPGRWMSSQHARLVRSRGTWVLEDAGSRNGTFVNGEKVERRTLADGEAFEAGRTLFAFRDALPTPAGLAADVDSASWHGLEPGMRTLLPPLAGRLEELGRVAATDVPVVLLGQTGTGKEVAARAVHSLSRRRGAFVAVNCGGLSPALVEGLLFGHVKGSFSGATRDEPGFVRAANGGTLFLDEIGDFPAAAQPSLLRVLQEREVVPLGTSRAVPVDFRVVVATHRDLDGLVRDGAFRRDLLTRLDGFRYTLPSLRERREDLGVLVAELLGRRGGADATTLTTAAARALWQAAWSGNVRELDQALGKGLALARDGVIDQPALGQLAQAAEGEPAALDPEDAALREQVIDALARNGGNVSEAARAMGKARMQLQRWMKRFGLDKESYRK